MVEFAPEKMVGKILDTTGKLLQWPIRPKEPEVIPGLRYASMFRRTSAQLIDSLFTVILLLPLVDLISAHIIGDPPVMPIEQMYAQAQAQPDQAFEIWLSGFMESGMWNYWMGNSLLQIAVIGVAVVLCWKRASATPGKWFLRMAIVDANSLRPMTRGQSVLRFFGYMVAGAPLMLGFFWASWDKRRQGWHDKMANTIVVALPKGKTMHDLAAMKEATLSK